MKPDLALRKRLLIYYALILFGFVFYKIWFYWTPDFVQESKHFVAESTADKATTDMAVAKAESIYRSYCRFWNVTSYKSYEKTDKHKLRIYKSRMEFKEMHPASSWAEAFYWSPVCYQYINSKATNPYHWMKHEIVHQLHREGSSFKMTKWVDEGLACLFSTAQEKNGDIVLGTIDPTTYPMWWIADLKFTGEVDNDMKANKLMKLEYIIKGEGGLPVDKYFNLYYIQWYSLVHFLVFGENGKYKDRFKKFVLNQCPVEEFEEYFGSVDEIQRKWYDHLSNTIRPAVVSK